MFLRDYLYVDLDKVSGLASQLYDGVPEKATNLAARQKRIEADLKLVRGGAGATSEESTQRSLGDSLFKDLETDLEALGVLRDLSADLTNSETWSSIEEVAPPGAIIRVTAPGTLFQPAQMSDAIVGLATAVHGLAELGDATAENAQKSAPPRQKTAAQKQAERIAREALADPRNPEDFLPAGETVPIMNIARSQFSGMIRMARGIFGEGIHMHLRPLGSGGPVISARLEEGRRFLDSSPEVLMSRYGLAQQDWTLVGVVGQLGDAMVSDTGANISNADGSVNRAAFVDLVANFFAETAGLVDLPRSPGFSVIPISVYRSIHGSIELEESGAA